MGNRALFRYFLAALTMASVLVGSVNVPAHAYPIVPYEVYGWYWLDHEGVTRGYITWNNRTAGLQGTVYTGAWTDTSLNYTTAYFEAFAGSTKIDSTTRTVGQSSPEPSRYYNFTIGDPDLVGGINRIRITVCDVTDAGAKICGDQVNYWRS